MINLSQHPLLALSIAIACVPVYRGLGVAVFGNRQGFQAAMRHCMTPSTWSFLKHPLDEDWNTGLRAFFFLTLCIAFVAAVCQLCVRYVS